jgi:opine dehydrogenase
MVLLNTGSRFFTEDIPYGLCILKNYGDLLGVKTPKIEEVLRFH